MHGERLPHYVRQHLERILNHQPGLEAGLLEQQDPDLAQPGAAFVTLTQHGELRGCIGSLVAYRALSHDLLDNAVSAAIRDPRFAPLTSRELPAVAVEVSVLTPPQPLAYDGPEDLLRRLQPGVHGVILRHSGRRSTFLPQVWEQLPDPATFLTHLCHKAGLEGHCWRHGAQVDVYTVAKYYESDRHP